MQWLIVGSVVALFIIGSAIALWWWKLAARIAPYEDEVARSRRRLQGTNDENDHVVIIPGSSRKDQR